MSWYQIESRLLNRTSDARGDLSYSLSIVEVDTRTIKKRLSFTLCSQLFGKALY